MIEKLEIEILNSGHITNSYIWYNEKTKEAVIIDAPDKAKVIINKVNELGLKVKYILLTHAHADHTMALEDLINEFNVKAVICENEKNMILGRINDCSNVFGVEQRKREESNFIFLKNEEQVPGMNITLYNTPGHTKGSAIYYLEKENILFTGDTLFEDTVGRWDLDTGSLDDTIESAIKIYNTFKKLDTVIYPGHNNSGMTVRDTYMRVSRVIFNNSGVDLSMLK